MSTRLAREYKDCQKNVNKCGQMKLFPTKSNDLYKWTGYLRGPTETPYEFGVFEVRINISKQYPMIAPKAIMVTKIFHPNIHFQSGEICLDILKDQWSPVWTIESVCRAIGTVLASPDSSSPLNCDAGNVLRAKDMKGFYSLAKMYTMQYAKQNLHYLQIDQDICNENQN